MFAHVAEIRPQPDAGECKQKGPARKVGERAHLILAKELIRGEYGNEQETQDELGEFLPQERGFVARRFGLALAGPIDCVSQDNESDHGVARGFHEISGIAWSGRGKVKHVDVSVDDGRTWQAAELQEPVLTRALTRFRLPWRWDGQSAVIQSRVIDETGYVQPTLGELLAVRGENYYYHNNAIWPWRIAADGEVTNAYA